MKRLDDGIPLTSGEAYAILRRNRDLRYAKGLPPFGMQSRGTPASMSGAMQTPFNPSWKNPRGDSKAAQKEAAIRASADFMQQNAVALNEVRGLFYLRPVAVADYGVSSVYSNSFVPTMKKTTATAGSITSSCASPAVDHDDSCAISTTVVAPPPAGDGGEFHAVRHFDAVGTKGHVACVANELDTMDRAGRTAQLQATKRLKSIAASFSALALTELELRNLLDIRPQTEVMVSALVPNMEERLGSVSSPSGSNEEASIDDGSAAAAAASQFAQRVIAVFQPAPLGS